MEYKNILNVIDELGALIEKYKNEISYKDIRIEHLENKIARIEQYIDTVKGG